jgi:methanogenic corrinoid protein MtbC1
MTTSQTPTYNIKVVLNQTGIAADTLRAWERRYGLPTPERTAGGHRLYSDRDIATIKWLLAKQEEGLSISHAVDLWNEIIASGSDPLAASQPKSFVPTENMNIEALRSEWLSACFNYDTVTADQILNQAFATHSIEIACTEIIMRGLFEVGEFWHKGTVTVQQEHFASGIATRRLEALISATPPPTRSETIVLACPPNEWHAFPLLLTNLFLRRRGWNVIYLGANVPIGRIEETIKATSPKLVVLSAQTLVNAVQLREMARALNKKGIQSAFGGRVFNNINGLAKRIPAHFLGNTIEYAIPAIENLIVNPVPVPKEEMTKKAIKQLAGEYHQHRSRIENTLGQTFDYLETANQFLGDSLTATLELGNISYLSTDMRWLSNLFINHNLSVAILPVYLESYARAVQQVMGENGKTISDWLNLAAQKS